MTKMGKLLEALKGGSYGFAELRDRSGLDTALLGQYLVLLGKKGVVEKAGTRKHYRYQLRAESGAEAVAEAAGEAAQPVG